jgi:hypothetical protein
MLVSLLLMGCGRKSAPSVETQFERMMTGAALVGRSTLDGKEGFRVKSDIPSTG